MAAVAMYKVRRPFVFEGRMRKIGEELIIDSREADTLYKKGLLIEERFLDPDNKDDAAKIAETKQKMAGKKAALADAKEARQADRNEREENRDTERKEREEKKAKLVEEAKSLIPDDGENNIETISKDIDNMDVEQLEATIEDFKTREKKNPDDVETPETPKTDGPNPSTKSN